MKQKPAERSALCWMVYAVKTVLPSCAAAKTIHGRETRKRRTVTSSKLRELHELEMLGRAVGIIRGSRVRGRTPGSKNLAPSGKG